jgi:hypothetical protein
MVAFLSVMRLFHINRYRKNAIFFSHLSVLAMLAASAKDELSIVGMSKHIHLFFRTFSRTCRPGLAIVARTA